VSRDADIAFDETGPIGSVGFDYDALDSRPEDVTAEDETRIRREAMFQLLGVLCERGSAKTIGRKCLTLAYILQAGDEKTHQDLARRLGVSRQAASAKVAKLRRGMGRLTRVS
jgi:hypothetical protein